MTSDTAPPYFPATTPAVFSGPPREVAGLIEPVLDQLAAVVRRPGERDLHGPTPCERLDVTELRDHILGWLQFFAAAFADPDRRSERPDPDGYRAADDDRDLGDVVRAAAATITNAVRGGVLDGQVVLASSRMDGPAAFAMVLGEYVLHGWDLARALDLPWTPPDAACEASLEFFQHMIVPEYRVGDMAFFGPEVPVPPDATPLERLLGFAGRDPSWRPGPSTTTSDGSS